jgi:hypothetical protein
MGHCGWNHDDVIDRLGAEIRSTRTRFSLTRWLVPLLIGFPLGGLIVLGTIGLLYYAGPQLESHFGPTIFKAWQVLSGGLPVSCAGIRISRNSMGVRRSFFRTLSAFAVMRYRSLLIGSILTVRRYR